MKETPKNPELVLRRQSASAVSAQHIPEHCTPQRHLLTGAHSLGTRAVVCLSVLEGIAAGLKAILLL